MLWEPLKELEEGEAKSRRKKTEIIKKREHYFLNTEAVIYVDKEVTCVEKYMINKELLEDPQHS